CSYPNAAHSDVQLLSNGLYLANQKKPQTAFTFALLDDFLIDNKECKTSAMTFYSKIWQVTNSAFPHKVPVHPSEFMRVSQQWRHLKYMHWHGFAHLPKCHHSLGSLALFCPACPQPGINVSLNWKQDPLRQYHLRIFVMNKNFNTECIKSKNPHDEVPLADDTVFLTANQPYMEHLKIAKENKVVSTCDDHRAVNLANKDQQHLDATGIGATACTWHRVFCPGALVDFQKGERGVVHKSEIVQVLTLHSQMSMDYSLYQALPSLAGINSV
ncbi:hypothetical protein SERLA73DRAFT_45127, partial [Serpula lacrymans var. lacrymans S7.3]